MDQLKSTRRRKKAPWLTGVLFLLLLCSGVASLYFLFQVNSEFKTIVEHELPITEVISQITVHKLEQTNWLERALRHAEIAAHGRQGDEENTRLLNEAEAKFREFAARVGEEVDRALTMSAEARKRIRVEDVRTELANIAESLTSIKREHAEYIDHANAVFALFASGDLSEAESAANQMEQREDDFNQRIETLLFESERNTQRFLSSVEQREGKAIILIAMIISMTLLLTIVILFLNYISADSRKARASRGRGSRDAI